MNSPINFYFLICLSMMVVHAAPSYANVDQKREQQVDERKVPPMNKSDRPSGQVHPAGPDNQQLPKDAYYKKPLTKDEREALRRQINDAERMYKQK